MLVANLQNRTVTLVLAIALALSGLALAGTASASCVGYAAQHPESGVRHCTGVAVEGNDIKCIGHDKTGVPGGDGHDCTGIQPPPLP